MSATWEIREGDCVALMAATAEASIDAVVCDPPYGIGFMGREWDGVAIREAAARDRATRQTLGPHSDSRPGRASARSSSAFGNEAIVAGPVRGGHDFQAWCESWAREALRALKPGGHLLAFGGTRTYHRLACGIEDAGFEVRDCIAWMYGSGFPKSLDVSKALDKDAGHWRGRAGGVQTVNGAMAGPNYERTDKGEPVTAAAAAAAGWGTALKPAFEPVIVARKPLAGTVAENWLAHGTGALNIDACRIATDDDLGGGAETGAVTGGRADGWDRPWKADPNAVARHAARARESVEKAEALGRWPANVVLDDEAAAALDEQSGDLAPGAFPARRDGIGYGSGAKGTTGDARDLDGGGASRFFYCAKASTAERNAGLDGFDPQRVHPPSGDDRCWDIPGSRSTPRANIHPTVKPVDLMRWLVRLVTPPGGLVLDPFAGSGTTGIAAVLEGFRFLGLEREAEYARIARARLAWWAEHPGFDTDRILAAAAERPGPEQGSLFGDTAAEVAA